MRHGEEEIEAKRGEKGEKEKAQRRTRQAFARTSLVFLLISAANYPITVLNVKRRDERGKDAREKKRRSNACRYISSESQENQLHCNQTGQIPLPFGCVCATPPTCTRLTWSSIARIVSSSFRCRLRRRLSCTLIFRTVKRVWYKFKSDFRRCGTATSWRLSL